MIYTVAEYLTAFIEAIMFYLMLDTFCGKKDEFPKYVYSLSVAALTVLIILCNQIFSYTLSNGIGMALSTFLISFMFSGNIPIKLIISVAGYMLASAMEVLTLFTITTVYGVTATVAINDQSLRLLGMIFSKLFAFALVSIGCMISKVKKLRLGKTYWAVFLLEFINSTLAIFLIYKLAYEADVTYMNYLLMICSLGLFISSFFLFYMCERMAKQNEIINRQQQYEQQIKSQEKHLDDILVNQGQLRSFRHDISQHITALRGYFEAGDYEGGMNYVDSMEQVVRENKNQIKTGNTAFDAIVNTKKALAENKNILFETKLQIPEKIPLSASDICVIFGNALDNAVEACERIKNGEKKIFLTFIYEKNSALCRISNTVAKGSSRSLKTLKRDKINHGLGVENIKTAISKYHNVFKITQNDEEFILEFVIFFS